MHYAYIDESFLVLPNGQYFMVVVGVITPDPRALLLQIRRLRKRRHIAHRTDLHASSTPAKFVKELLQSLRNDTFISIVAVAWEGPYNRIESQEHLYRVLVAQCVAHIVRHHRRVDLYIHKRYTNKFSQQELERSIREALAKYSENIVRIFQENSQATSELIAPDFVAWAYLQHYCRGKQEFYNIIKPKVTVFHDTSVSPQKKAAPPRH